MALTLFAFNCYQICDCCRRCCCCSWSWVEGGSNNTLLPPQNGCLLVYGSLLSSSGCIIHERGGVCGACPMPSTANKDKKSEKNKYAHMRTTRRGRTRAGAKGFGSLLNCVATHLFRAYMTQLSSRTTTTTTSTTAATTREAHASSVSVMFIKLNLYLHFKQYAN